MLIAALATIALYGSPPKTVVCIDPGHPSEVSRGTKGAKVSELRVVWEVALALEKKLESQGIDVVLTKGSIDEVVTNRARAEVANKAGADLMLRLHCDAASGSGFAVYYPTRSGKAQGVTGPSREMLAKTAPVAKRFHQGMSGVLAGKLKNNGLKSDLATFIGGKQGALTGSVFSKVPTVLVELVVLTNPKDEAFILSKNGRAALIDGLEAGTLNALQK